MRDEQAAHSKLCPSFRNDRDREDGTTCRPQQVLPSRDKSLQLPGQLRAAANPVPCPHRTNSLPVLFCSTTYVFGENAVLEAQSAAQSARTRDWSNFWHDRANNTFGGEVPSPLSRSIQTPAFIGPPVGARKLGQGFTAAEQRKKSADRSAANSHAHKQKHVRRSSLHARASYSEVHVLHRLRIISRTPDA